MSVPERGPRTESVQANGSAQIVPTPVELSSKVGRLRAEFGRNGFDTGRIRRKSGQQLAQKLASFDQPSLPDLHRLGAELDQTRVGSANFVPLSTAFDLLTCLGSTKIVLKPLAHIRPKTRHRPNSGKLVRNRPDGGPKSAKVGPRSANLVQTWTGIGLLWARNRPKTACFRSSLARFRQSGFEIDQIGPTWARRRPTQALIRASCWYDFPPELVHPGRRKTRGLATWSQDAQNTFHGRPAEMATSCSKTTHQSTRRPTLLWTDFGAKAQRLRELQSRSEQRHLSDMFSRGWEGREWVATGRMRERAELGGRGGPCAGEADSTRHLNRGRRAKLGEVQAEPAEIAQAPTKVCPASDTNFGPGWAKSGRLRPSFARCRPNVWHRERRNETDLGMLLEQWGIHVRRTGCQTWRIPDQCVDLLGRCWVGVLLPPTRTIGGYGTRPVPDSVKTKDFPASTRPANVCVCVSRALRIMPSATGSDDRVRAHTNMSQEWAKGRVVSV